MAGRLKLGQLTSGPSWVSFPRMSFRLSEMMILVAQKPKDAAQKLNGLFKDLHTRSAVAEALDCSPESIRRWMATLEDKGHPVTADRAGPGRPARPDTPPKKEKRRRTPRRRKP